MNKALEIHGNKITQPNIYIVAIWERRKKVKEKKWKK